MQVVNEFANVLRKKQRLEWPRIEAALTVVERWFEAVRPLTLNTHKAAVGIARDAGTGLYDALIVAAAIEAGCDRLSARTCNMGAYSPAAPSSIRSSEPPKVPRERERVHPIAIRLALPPAAAMLVAIAHSSRRSARL